MWYLDENGAERNRRSSLDEDYRPNTHHQLHEAYDDDSQQIVPRHDSYLDDWKEGRDDSPDLSFSYQKARAERMHNRIAFHSLRRNGATHQRKHLAEADYDSDQMLADDIDF